MEFRPSPGHTVGIEWELQLLDDETLDLSNGIVPLLEFFPNTSFVKPELIQSCVELNTCVAATTSEAVAHLGVTLAKILRRCSELELSVCGGGIHPFCRRLALITPLPRYRKLEESAGYLAHTQVTFSTHVHVGMDDGDQAMRAMARLTPALPAFIALSANSPFFRGHETGHAAYRHRILAATPNYGLPTVFASWRDFNDFFDAAVRAKMARHFKDIHWDLRPHPDFGTLELRIMDSGTDLDTVYGLAAFARCLMIALAEAEGGFEELIPHDLPYWAQKQNHFRAAHLGLDAEYIVDGSGKYRPLRGLVAELVDFCRPVAERLGESAGLERATALLSGPAGYEAQVEAYREAGSARAVVELLRDRLGASVAAESPDTDHAGSRSASATLDV